MQNSPPPPLPAAHWLSADQTGPDRTCDVLLDVEPTRKAAGEKRLEAGKWPKSCDKLTLAQLHTSPPQHLQKVKGQSSPGCGER